MTFLDGGSCVLQGRRDVVRLEFGEVREDLRRRLAYYELTPDGRNRDSQSPDAGQPRILAGSIVIRSNSTGQNDIQRGRVVVTPMRSRQPGVSGY